LKPLVSVVMPVFNGERFLRPAVESILGQTFGEFEFVIVNDGSTDTTASMLGGYRDERIRIVDHKTNLGITRSLNEAILASVGNYVCRMDADDISLPPRLERQVAFLESHPDIALIGTNTVLIDGSGNVTGEEHYPETPSEVSRTIFRHNPFAHGSVMMRRRVLDECGLYSTRFRHNEDYDLWLRIVAIHPAGNLPEPLLKRRVHGGNITVARQTELVRFRVATLAHAMASYYHKPHYAVFLVRPLLAYGWRLAKGAVSR
jgi:glycosyltransferase involved in cell wall biosynthesis